MKILKRTQFGNPILRKKTKKISLSELKKPTFKKLIQQMFFTMRQTHGVGLAAPQVDKGIRLAVIEVKKNKIRPKVKPLLPTVVLNPKIISSLKEKISDWEGCLSLPKVRALVPRYKSIVVEYYDEKRNKQKVKLEGFQARVFQHEIDHLNGVLYIDRIIDRKSLITDSEFKKLISKKGLKSK